MDMTKKKHSVAAAETTTETAPAVRDASPEKETVERQEQVSQLLSRIDDLAMDHSFLSATEQDVASHLADLRSLAAARELELSADRDAAEKEVRSLSEALKQADEKLNLAAREKEEIENRLDSVVSERDSIRKDADRKRMALIYFDSKARQWQIFVSVMQETLNQLRIMISKSLLVLESKEEALLREKNAIEIKLEEQQAQVESLMAEKEVFEVKILALEERHRCLVRKNQLLQCEVHSLKEKEEIQKALRLEKLVVDLKKIEDVTGKLKSQVEELKKIEGTRASGS